MNIYAAPRARFDSAEPRKPKKPIVVWVTQAAFALFLATYFFSVIVEVIDVVQGEGKREALGHWLKFSMAINFGLPFVAAIVGLQRRVPLARYLVLLIGTVAVAVIWYWFKDSHAGALPRTVIGMTLATCGIVGLAYWAYAMTFARSIRTYLGLSASPPERS